MKRVLRTTMMALLVMVMMVSVMAPAAFAAYEPVSVQIPVTVNMSADPVDGKVPESDEISVSVVPLEGAQAVASGYTVICNGDGSTGTGSVNLTFGDYVKPGIHKYGVTIGLSSQSDWVINDAQKHYVVIISVINKQDYSGLEIKVGIRDAEMDASGAYIYSETSEVKPDAMVSDKVYASPMDITVSKRWASGSPRAVTINLYEIVDAENTDYAPELVDSKGRVKINSVTLTGEENTPWQHVFTGSDDGKLLDSRKADKYVLDEDDLAGFHESYHYDKETNPLHWFVTITNTKKLYQTGQLNWPIPVLVCFGTMFMMAGVVLLKKKEELTNE